MGSFAKGILALLFVFGSASALAASPACPAYGRDLGVNNSQVLHWERTTSNQFLERAHIQGAITEVFPNKNGHAHFSVQIGSHDGDLIEVIYNEDFGPLPELEPGMNVEACGDYITSTAQSGPYPPSPDGAILHWVHMNPNNRGHDPGFLIINGHLYGQDAADAGPGRHGRHGGGWND